MKIELIQLRSRSRSTRVVLAKSGCEHEQPIYSNWEETSQTHYDVKILYSNYYIVCLVFKDVFNIFGNINISIAHLNVMENNCVKLL